MFSLEKIVKYSFGAFIAMYIYYIFFGTSNAVRYNQSNQRWAEYNSQNISDLKLDIDSVYKAFKEAKGPQEFEKTLNEIYTGSEVLSINVQSNSHNNNQSVSIYIDKNQDSKMDDSEKLFVLTREIDKSNKQVRLSSVGYGPYGYYSTMSPITYGIVSGMTNYWIMRTMMYNTPFSRLNYIRDYRKSYRTSDLYKRQAMRTRNFSSNFKRQAPSRFKSSTKSFSSTPSSNRWSRGSSKSTWGSRAKGFFSRSGRSGFRMFRRRR